MSFTHSPGTVRTIVSIVFSLWSFGLSITAVLNFFSPAPFLTDLLLVFALGELLLCTVYYKVVVKPRHRSAGSR